MKAPAARIAILSCLAVLASLVTVLPARADPTQTGADSPFSSSATPKPKGLTHVGRPLPQKVEMKFTKKTTHAKKHAVRPVSPLKNKDE